MKTEIFEIYNKNNKKIDEVCSILKNGGVVALPTETVYGLAANALDENAVKKIFAAKGRPADNPLIVHIATIEQLYKITKNVPKEALLCINAFWPGPFTVILPKKSIVPNITSGGLNTVAVRCPKNPIINQIIKKSGVMLAAPSANISGSPSPTAASHVLLDMNGKIDGIVCSYDCPIGIESTVVSFLNNEVRLLRPGKITAEQIKKIVPNLIIDGGIVNNNINNKKALSPGMKYKHYAPKCNVTLINGKKGAFIKFVNRKNIMVLAENSISSNITAPKILLGPKPEQHIFSALRQLDEMGVKQAFVHSPQKRGVGLALYNRLIRAAGFNEISLPIIIGLTGPSGAGKTAFAKMAQNNNIEVIDCDKAAKEVTNLALPQLKKAFGNDIVNNNTLDRRLLSVRAFSSQKNTEKLNSIMFPFIINNINSKIKKSDFDIILLDGATLIESGLADTICKKIIVVTANSDIRLKRFKTRDNLTDEQAKARLNAAKEECFYTAKAHFVINNNGTLQQFNKKAQQTINKLINCDFI